MSIANVQDPDAGGITVNVIDNVGATGSSSASLTVVDPPTGPNLTQSQSITPVSAGSVDVLSSSATGTQPFTYQWYLGTNAIIGATGSNLVVNVAASGGSSYSVVISNPAGSVTNTTVIGPVSVVPDQIVFEPFNYVPQPVTQSSANPWTATAAGQTNVAGLPQVVSYIYNQATGVGLLWQQEGTVGQEWTLQQDMRIEPGDAIFYSNYNDFNGTANASFGDVYPWPGLAGNDPNEMACNSGNTDVVLPLGTGGSISNGTVYFSVIMHVDQGSSLTEVDQQYFCGFGTGAASSTTFNASIYINVPGNGLYTPGVFKVAAGNGSLNPGVNGNWSSKSYHLGEIVFAVVRLTINAGITNDTCDLWLDPNPSTFYAGEGKPACARCFQRGWRSGGRGQCGLLLLQEFQQPPFSRRYTDLRIGRTWDSVTPPSAPTLSLSDIVLPPGVTTAKFTSENAGNPISGYQWQFNNGSPLSDGPTGHGSTISGTATGTLTITGITAADLGLYTVTGVNFDPAPSGQVQFGATYTAAAPRRPSARERHPSPLFPACQTSSSRGPPISPGTRFSRLPR